MFADKVIPLDIWVSEFVDWLVNNYRDFFQALKWPVEKTLNGFDSGLNALPPWIVILAIALLAWKFSGIRLAVFSLISLTIIGLLGLWGDTMTTLAMVLSSVIFCAVVGVPLGIWAGRSDRFQATIRPMLDAMQTTPAFVYLVPIVMLFSVGNVAGVLATIVFALPPIIRLTSLGPGDPWLEHPGHRPGGARRPGDRADGHRAGPCYAIDGCKEMNGNEL
jgi:glycine betaine/proline transport system permease protein